MPLLITHGKHAQQQTKHDHDIKRKDTLSPPLSCLCLHHSIIQTDTLSLKKKKKNLQALSLSHTLFPLSVSLYTNTKTLSLSLALSCLCLSLTFSLSYIYIQSTPPLSLSLIYIYTQYTPTTPPHTQSKGMFVCQFSKSARKSKGLFPSSRLDGLGCDAGHQRLCQTLRWLRDKSLFVRYT